MRDFSRYNFRQLLLFTPVTKMILPILHTYRIYSAAPTFGRHLSNRLSTLVSNSIRIIPLRAKIENTNKDLIRLEGCARNRDHKTNSCGSSVKLSNHDSNDAPADS